MGKVMSAMTKNAVRSLKNVNVEERAYKYIKQDKMMPAPHHPTSEKYIADIRKQTPAADEMYLPSKELVERLHSVYVTSEDVEPIYKMPQSNRPLPVNRENSESPEFGFLEPETVPEGKITLRNVLDILSKHHLYPTLWTPASIAKQHKLDVKLTEQLLQHFGTFTLYMSDKTSQKYKITQGQLQSSPLIQPCTIKELPSGIEDKVQSFSEETVMESLDIARKKTFERLKTKFPSSDKVLDKNELSKK